MTASSIDILMATYNGERFLGEQIESIQAQSYKNWRLLVSDDCSADGTLDVVRHYAAADDRIRIVSEGVRRGGAKENFFALMAKSAAPYCMFCDQDDVWLPQKVEKTFNLMRQLEAKEGPDKPLLVFTDMKVVDGELGVIDESFECFSSIDPGRTGFKQLVAQSVGAGCTMLVNKCARDLALRLATYDDVIMHDWWLCLVAAAFGRIAYLDEPTSLYRQHDFNEVGALEYSPVKRASQLGQLKKNVSATVRQASAFAACYEGLLSQENVKSIEEFVSAGNEKGFAAVAHLARSGCWKKGLRKAGQLAVFFSGLEGDINA